MRAARHARSSIAAGLIAAACLIAPLRAADPRAGTLVGRWRSLDTDPSGMASLFEFREGGSFDYSPGNVVEMTYRVEGDSLVLPSESKGGPEHRQTIAWLDQDHIRLSAPGTMSLILARHGPHADAPKASAGIKAPEAPRTIVGEWTGPREIGGRSVEALYLFAPDGKLLLVMAVLTSQGRYTVDGDKIHLGVSGKWEAEGTFRVDGDTLSLSIASAKGPRESKYTRY